MTTPEEAGRPSPSAGHGTRSLETVIVPRTRDLGDGFEVRRALPSAQRRMVGPFVFLDQMGPAVFRSGAGLDVRPHPHIGLATVTYLFEGEIVHRDSLGVVQPIRPGAVNWMTAGRGIVHSERTGDDVRAAGGALFGLQTWLALPRANEEAEPAFSHHDDAALPLIEGEGMRLRLIAGSLFGKTSPVRVFSDMFYADLSLSPGSRLALPPAHEERAAYLVEGTIQLLPGSSGYAAGQLLVFRPGEDIVLAPAEGPARLMLLGGEPMDGPRHIWWNFVSSSTERIEAAKADWQAGRFPRVPEETEFIPLPDSRPPPVDYP